MAAATPATELASCPTTLDNLPATEEGRRILTCIQCGTSVGARPHGDVMQYPPRRIIAMLRAGMVEMARDRMNSLCCRGGGGGTWLGKYRKLKGFERLSDTKPPGTGSSRKSPACAGAIASSGSEAQGAQSCRARRGRDRRDGVAHPTAPALKRRHNEEGRWRVRE